MIKESPQVLKISKKNADLISSEFPNLSKLIHSGFHVPKGFIITTEAFNQFLKENELMLKIKNLLSTAHFDRADSLMQISTHIKKMITESSLPTNLNVEIETEYKKLGKFFNNAYVVVGESNEEKIKGVENLITKIKHIWADKFEPKHLISYKKYDIETFEFKISIPVQKIINLKKIGLLITSIYSIDTKYNLSSKQRKNIISLGKKLKKYFYFPQIVTWAIEGNKIYILSINTMTNTQNSYLTLIRHGTSEYNEKGLWTGWTDINMTKKGEEDVRIAAETLKDINFDIGFTSPLARHIKTLEILKNAINNNKLSIII